MNPTLASTILAPSKSNNQTTYDRLPVTLSGSGTTESHNEEAPMAIGKMATLMVGDVPVRVAFLDSSGESSVVDTTDLVLPAGFAYTWTVDALTRFVYMEAADGSSSYEAWVWRSS